jgi:SAM-dependent methyltransferase
LIKHQHGHDFYDHLHDESNISETCALYNPLFQKVLKKIQDRGSRFVLEVGCGNGFLAEMILRQSRVAYRGFDFSAVAVRNAADRTGLPELFFRGDALDVGSYAFDYDTIVCTEVLEHLDSDLDVIRIWRAGTWCVCTVPNFDYDSHVRYFRSADEVATRYGELVDIKVITKVRRPLILNGQIRKYFRTLRWSRNDPSRFLGYIGVHTFDRLGGWFLFCGPKKPQNE